MTTAQEFIAHYGVKGMKWGVRKKRTSAEDAKSKAKKLSDEELRAAINRMEMERRFVDLSNPRTRSAGREFALGILSNVARTAITGLATQQVARAVRRAAPGS